MEAVKLCFEAIGGLIEKEHKESKARFESLDRSFMKFRLGRVYEDKQAAIKSYIEKGNKNKNSREKVAQGSIAKESTPIVAPRSSPPTTVIDL